MIGNKRKRFLFDQVQCKRTWTRNEIRSSPSDLRPLACNEQARFKWSPINFRIGNIQRPDKINANCPWRGTLAATKLCRSTVFEIICSCATNNNQFRCGQESRLGCVRRVVHSACYVLFGSRLICSASILRLLFSNWSHIYYCWFYLIQFLKSRVGL